MLSMDAVQSVFSKLNQDLPAQGITSLVIPAIGAGLARGNWNQIVEVINQVTPALDIHVVIWDQEKDQKLLAWARSMKKTLPRT